MNIKNKTLTSIEIESMAAEGKCVARYEGQVIFVNGVAPGDVVDLHVFRKKKKFLEARVVKFHKLSSKRVDPFCSHFGTCGGCKWQHIGYDTQLQYKHQQVIDALERIAKVPIDNIHPILPSQETNYYRNKLEFTFSNKRWLTSAEINSDTELERRALGFHIPGRFDKVLDIDHCYLQSEPSNSLRNWLRIYALEHDLEFYDLVQNAGFLRNLIIRTSSTGEVMVILQVAENKPELITALLDKMYEDFPGITSLNYIVNLKLNETFHDQEVVNYRGLPQILEEMTIPDGSGKKLKFRIGPKSFYQTNSHQAERLYNIAYNFADLTGNEVVYDLYTGTGTIANYLAHKASKVIGVEYIEAAVEDARINSSENGIENTAFFAGDMKDLLSDEFIAIHGKPDVVITDPPRAGMHEDVVNVLKAAAPKRIVYVSCNPATQARDIAWMSDKYKVSEVQPVDMFPHTHHVENVVLLELISA